MRYFVIKDGHKQDQELLHKILTGRGVNFNIYNLNHDQIINDIKTCQDYKKIIIVYDPSKRDQIKTLTTWLTQHKIDYQFINIVTTDHEEVATRIIDRILSDRRVNDKVNDNTFFPDDKSKMIHGVEKHYGNLISNVPLIFSRYGHNMWFDGMYKGRAAFLVLGGPSLLKVDYNKLLLPGIITLGVNNSPKTIRPSLWTCVDDPASFLKSIWLDPRIMKFVPYTHSEKTLFDSATWKMTNILVGECPNVWYFKRNERFNAKQFLTEDTFNWGGHTELDGARSVMLVAIRLLYYLGIRTVYLVGCDFKMDTNTKYHFAQDRTNGSIRSNNNTYNVLKKRFAELKPIFEKNKFNIYNCSPGSHLTVFPFIDFEQAVANSVLDIGVEQTDGLYDRKSKMEVEKVTP